MGKNILVAAVLLLSVTAKSQNKQDSTKVNTLREVVVTGQFEPQSLKKSVHNVRIITRNDIENRGANNLSDILNQYLNITIVPNSGTGQSSVSMFGLNGLYFKILVDNIPIVSDNSVGNNIDLTTINLDDIEQIEIIEGSMGVTHGANAISGILNIITKKSSKNKWQINSFVQEETVGNEYKAFTKGRHIQSVKVSTKISDSWFVSSGVNRNDFKGFLDNKKGADYTGSDLLRGYTWLPREQFFGNATIKYHRGNFRAFYKFDYLNETIDYYNLSIVTISNPPFGVNMFAEDSSYLTNRFLHHLNLNGNLSSLKYNLSASFQQQVRDLENFDYNFQTNREENNYVIKQQQSDVLYSTGSLTNFFSKNSKADIQLGYELVNTKGFALVDGENQTKVPIEKRLENYDLYVVSEIKPSSRFSIRPGLRVSMQSKFDSQNASSLGLKYSFDRDLEIRFSLGKSFRVPTFEELYSKIKFSGHQFYGNENLEPELSTSYEININKKIEKNAGSIESKASVSYLDVDDRIEMAYIGTEDSSPVYQYINISTYKMWNASTSNSFSKGNFNFSLGAILVGISQVIDDGEAVSSNQFLYNVQMNSCISYDAKKWQTLFSVYYKYNGKQQQFQRTSENGQAVFVLSEIEPYSFLDASIRKSFFKKKVEITLGGKNLLDITRIDQGIAASGHNDASSIVLGYGRSYFLKLSFNLNF